MKILLLSLIGLLGLNVAFAEEPDVQYGIEAKNMIYEGVEKSFIVITITNASDKELKHIGYGFTAESFSAIDSKGKKLEDSLWVSVLRRKLREANPIIVPAKSKIHVMYSLDQLFKLKTKDKITVVWGLSQNLKIEINTPK